MKRLFILLMLSLCCLSSYGQTKDEAKAMMRSAIQVTNEYLPLSLGVMTMDKITIQGNDLVVYITIDETQLDFDEYMSNTIKSKAAATAMVVGQNEEFGALIKQSGMNLMYVVKGNISGREDRVFYSSVDLANALDFETGMHDMLVQMVFQTRNELPQYWDNSTVLTDVYLEDGYFCYEVMTDESELSIQGLKELKSMGTIFEESMLEGVASASSPVEKIFWSYIRTSNSGVKYVFWSETSAERIAFYLTPEMLSGVIEKDFPLVN